MYAKQNNEKKCTVLLYVKQMHNLEWEYCMKVNADYAIKNAKLLSNTVKIVECIFLGITYK